MNLPVDEKIFEIPSQDRACPQCGQVMTEMKGQFEETEEISVVRRIYFKVVRRCQKYRCRCNSSVVTAPVIGQRKLIPGGRYSPEFAVEVCVDKFLDHNPLERQVRAMAREGLEVTSKRSTTRPTRS